MNDEILAEKLIKLYLHKLQIVHPAKMVTRNYHYVFNILVLGILHG